MADADHFFVDNAVLKNQFIIQRIHDQLHFLDEEESLIVDTITAHIKYIMRIAVTTVATEEK